MKKKWTTWLWLVIILLWPIPDILKWRWLMGEGVNIIFSKKKGTALLYMVCAFFVLGMLGGFLDWTGLMFLIWTWEWNSSWKRPEPCMTLWSLSITVECMLWGSDRYSNPVWMVVEDLGWLCLEFLCFFLVWHSINKNFGMACFIIYCGHDSKAASKL